MSPDVRPAHARGSVSVAARARTAGPGAARAPRRRADGQRRWEIAALEGARSHLGRTRFIVELHPDAWQWSGHTPPTWKGCSIPGAGGAPAQRPARPAPRAWASRPRGESNLGEVACLKGNREGEKGRIRDLGGGHALASVGSPTVRDCSVVPPLLLLHFCGRLSLESAQDPESLPAAFRDSMGGHLAVFSK